MKDLTSFFMEKISHSQIQQLKDYFARQPEVSMAFIFGSYAKNRALSDSDIDIAMYFTPKGNSIEWEEEREWPEEKQFWIDTERILEKNVDLLVLNRAPSRMVFDILRTGIPLVIKDKSLYWRFFLLISSAAIEFQEFVNDFRVIRNRSHSLNEEDKIRLYDLLDYIDEEIKSYEEFKNLDQIIYQNDRNKKRSVEHWVESIVITSIDIAKILLASNHLAIPSTYREILFQLSNISGFDKEMAERLSYFAKLRNVITHEYLDLRWKQIHEFIITSQPLYEYLLNFIRKNY